MVPAPEADPAAPAEGVGAVEPGAEWIPTGRGALALDAMGEAWVVGVEAHRPRGPRALVLHRGAPGALRPVPLPPPEDLGGDWPSARVQSAFVVVTEMEKVAVLAHAELPSGEAVLVAFEDDGDGFVSTVQRLGDARLRHLDLGLVGGFWMLVGQLEDRGSGWSGLFRWEEDMDLERWVRMDAAIAGVGLVHGAETLELAYSRNGHVYTIDHTRMEQDLGAARVQGLSAARVGEGRSVAAWDPVARGAAPLDAAGPTDAGAGRFSAGSPGLLAWTDLRGPALAGVVLQAEDGAAWVASTEGGEHPISVAQGASGAVGLLVVGDAGVALRRWPSVAAAQAAAPDLSPQQRLRRRLDLVGGLRVVAPVAGSRTGAPTGMDWRDDVEYFDEVWVADPMPGLGARVEADGRRWDAALKASWRGGGNVRIEQDLHLDLRLRPLVHPAFGLGLQLGSRDGRVRFDGEDRIVAERGAQGRLGLPAGTFVGLGLHDQRAPQDSYGVEDDEITSSGTGEVRIFATEGVFGWALAPVDPWPRAQGWALTPVAEAWVALGLFLSQVDVTNDAAHDEELAGGQLVRGGGAVALDLRRRLDGDRAGALFGRVGLEGSGRYATTGNLMDEGVAFVRLDWRFVPTLEAGGVF